MKYVFDHDFHIHSELSSCSRDPEQSPARILKYAEDEGLHTIVIADHFWDETGPAHRSGISRRIIPTSVRQSLCRRATRSASSSDARPRWTKI